MRAIHGALATHGGGLGDLGARRAVNFVVLGLADDRMTVVSSFVSNFLKWLYYKFKNKHNVE